MHITKKQQEILTFLKTYYAAYNISPTMREIGEHFKITTPAVQSFLRILKTKGCIQKVPNISRGIDILFEPKNLSQILLDKDLEKIEFFYNSKTKKVLFYSLDYSKLSRSYEKGERLELTQCWLETDLEYAKRQVKQKKRNLKLTTQREVRELGWELERAERLERKKPLNKIKNFLKMIFKI